MMPAQEATDRKLVEEDSAQTAPSSSSDDVTKTGERGGVVLTAGAKGGFSTALCDCYQLCCIHSLWWMPLCCSCVVLGQLMQRLGLTWLAENVVRPGEYSNTCTVVTALGVVNVALAVVMTISVGVNVTGPFFALYFLIVACVTRNHFRKLYEISPLCCAMGWVEDFCCMCWCGCCNLIQMMRHTATTYDDSHFRYDATSPTGLSSDEDLSQFLTNKDGLFHGDTPSAAAPPPRTRIAAFSSGLCDWYQLCCVRSLFWMSCCCKLIVLGQLMQRLGLTWRAQKGQPPDKYSKTCRIITYMAIAAIIAVPSVAFVLDNIMGVDVLTVTDLLSDDKNDLSYLEKMLEMMDDDQVVDDNSQILEDALLRRRLLEFVFAIPFVILACITRNHFRKLYEIPPQICSMCGGWLEDFCCMSTLMCCNLVQLIRHTHDEDHFPYKAISSTGLPSDAPTIV